MIEDRRCNCRYPHHEGVKWHEAGCPMRRAPASVPRDPARFANPVAITTGGPLPCPACGATGGCLHGIPAAIGVEEPLTIRVGDYLGQPRPAVSAPTSISVSGQIDGTPLPARAATALGRLLFEPLHEVTQEASKPDDDWMLLQPEDQRLIEDIKAAEDVGSLRKAIDRFMASVYDRMIDGLAARRREHTKRLGH